MTSSTGEAVAPMNIDAEEAVLGAALLEGGACLAEFPFLRSECFVSVPNQTIFRAMERLRAREEPCDYLLVVEELDRVGDLARIGGSAALTKLLYNSAVVSHHVPHYARLVFREWQRRRVIEVAGEMAQAGWKSGEDVAGALAYVRTQIEMLDSETASVESGDPREAYDEMGGPQPDPVSTGVERIDNWLGGGLRGGRVVVVTGPSNAGKTWVLSSFTAAALAAGRSVAYFSLEMSRRDILARIGAARTGGHALRLASLPRERWDEDDAYRYERIGSELIDSGRWSLYAEQFDLARINAIVRRESPDIVFLDYYQNLDWPPGAHNDNEADRANSRAIELGAKRSGACYVVASQMDVASIRLLDAGAKNQAGGALYGKRLHQRADHELTISVHRDSTADRPLMKIAPTKNRFGRNHATMADGECDFLMDKRTGALVPA